MSGAIEKGSTTTKTPADFLKSIRGRPVVVKLNPGVDYRGILACLDGYMNIAMEQTEEYFNGQLKNKYGDAFVRGHNVLYVSTSKRTIAEGAYLVCDEYWKPAIFSVVDYAEPGNDWVGI